MWLQKLWQRQPNRSVTGRRTSSSRHERLALEQLEDRCVPANFSASNVSDLIADIHAANQTPEADTITLAPGETFTLTAANNTDYGPTGLPTIAANGALTIIGNGAVIERSKAIRTPAFRLFTVAAGAALTLENLTVQGGHAVLWGNFATVGGGIANFGTLSLHGVTVQNNVAGRNLAGEDPALGGGIFSNGTLSVTGSAVRNNQVFGSTALGGGLCIGGGTVTILGTAVAFNEARGSPKSKEFPAGQGIGGGLYIASSAVVSLDAFTAAHVAKNKASTSDPNIYGFYSELI